ncbi:NAD(P)/FAD-dependent oxidoreductase [Saccharopolyspora sp. 5N708]|uniref:NAD(P)/FAD-dependent oxidoreductase n=1 Tax=Saccharopolyspora sp. 5N708 TaxID=3457424 RepID=UPI003FCFE272
MSHHVVVIGAGYAGLMAAKRIARQVRPAQVQVTLVNAREHFVERVRLHQLAAGQRLRTPALTELVRGTGIEVVVGVVRELDRTTKQLRIQQEGPLRTVSYDTLVYALGSYADTHTVPGVADHAHTLAELDHAADFASRALPGLARSGGRVCVVGAGLTGIEAAAELAEAHPALRISLVSGDVVGPGLSAAGRAHIHRTLSRLGVEIREHVKVAAVSHDGLRLVDGTSIAADAVLWNAGFAVSELARNSLLEVDASGRIVVDGTQRSVSDPDVYAVGDAATVPGPGGRELRMACATGTPMAVTAADAIVARLSGRTPRKHRFTYLAQNVSLGRRDGLFQFVRTDDTPRPIIFIGRRAALAKELVVRFAAKRSQRLNGPYPRARRFAPSTATRRRA